MAKIIVFDHMCGERKPMFAGIHVGQFFMFENQLCVRVWPTGAASRNAYILSTMESLRMNYEDEVEPQELKSVIPGDVIKVAKYTEILSVGTVLSTVDGNIAIVSREAVGGDTVEVIWFKYDNECKLTTGTVAHLDTRETKPLYLHEAIYFGHYWGGFGWL